MLVYEWLKIYKMFTKKARLAKIQKGELKGSELSSAMA